jgi:hypothetical protein
MTGKVDIIKDDKVDCRVICVKVNGSGQRLGLRKVLERAISVYRYLGRSRTYITVNHTEVRWITAKLLGALCRGSIYQYQRKSSKSH